MVWILMFELSISKRKKAMRLRVLEAYRQRVETYSTINLFQNFCVEIVKTFEKSTNFE